MMNTPDLTDLENQARYHRDRAALYRAKMHGSKPTSVERLEREAWHGMPGLVRPLIVGEATVGAST